MILKRVVVAFQFVFGICVQKYFAQCLLAVRSHLDYTDVVQPHAHNAMVLMEDADRAVLQEVVLPETVHESHTAFPNPYLEQALVLVLAAALVQEVAAKVLVLVLVVQAELVGDLLVHRVRGVEPVLHLMMALISSCAP